MAQTTARQAREVARVTPAEATLGPVAGALVGYATFGVLITVFVSLAGGRLAEHKLRAVR